jgi:MFS transporter
MGTTDVQVPEAPARPGTPASRLEAVAGRPWVGLLVVAAVALAMGWQFITDASRAVPAFDTAYYQWRVEYLLHHDPGSMIELRGAVGALAGGYRVAEPVLGALMRTVGGVAAAVPTVVLSILFRILSAVGMAAFAWRHRRNWLLFYLTVLAVPALFLLQRFFGYMDNFMTLALLAGVLLLMDRMADSWGARVAVISFLFLAGMSHPTTLAIFLLSMGAVAGYRLLRDRSLLSALRSEGLIIATGTAAVFLTAAFWLGGLWGPTSSFSDAAVPPPADVAYFVTRSVGVLESLEPFFPVLVLFPLMALALIHLVIRVVRHGEYFAELTVGWTLPLLGMLGFLIGAAYPYFRFFNATVAPELLAALGLFLVIWGASRVRGGAGRAVTGVAVVAVGFALAVWWSNGLSAWNAGGTWLTPEVRETTAAASGYLRATPEHERALFVVDAQGAAPLPYGEYKNFANAINAGVDGDQIADVAIFYGRVEDLVAGRASTFGDAVYDDIAAETADEALPVLEGGNVVVFMPAIMNEKSTNADFLAACGPDQCVEVGATGLYLLADVGGTPPEPRAIEAATARAGHARAFADDPPGPLAGFGGTLVSILRLALLFVLPGWLFYRRFQRRSWPEALALVPLFSIASTTVAGLFAVAVLRGPFTPAVGWISWAIAVALGLFGRLPEGLRRRRDRVVAVPARIIDDASELFRNRSFTFLMGAQWLGQMADGLVATALAKLITFGGAAGFDPESARSPREALLIVLLTFLPYSLFSPFIGVLIDRWDRRRLLLGANALRAVVLTAIVAIGLGRLGDPALYVSLLLVLAGTRLLLAIKGASLPAVLGERELLQGNAISQAGSAVFQLFGAGVAFVASAKVGTPAILIAGILVYVLATAAATGTRNLGYAKRVTPLREEVGRLFRDMFDGFREVARRAAAGLALTSFLVIRTLLTFTVLATAFISREFIVERGAVTTVAGAVGALGAVAGFVAAALARQRVRPVRIVTGALILGGVGMLAFGGIINLLGISLMAFTVGVSFFLGKVGVDTMMQEALADSFRGRGFSLQDIAYNFSWIIPALVLFLFLTPSVARALMIGAGVVFLALAVLITLWARRIPATATPEPERAR